MVAQFSAGGIAPWRRRSWLALIGAAHLFAVWCWRAPLQHGPQHPVARGTLTYILLPQKPVPPANVIPPIPPARRPLAPPRIAAPATQPTAQPSTPSMTLLPPAPAAALTSAPSPASAAAPAADPFALPAKPTAEEDTLLRARRSAGAIDKQLRKEAWNPRDKKIAHDRTLLAEKLASAYTGSDGMTQESVTLDDGRVMTRIRTGAGTTFCAVKESNGLTGGRDPFRDGIRTKVTSCGR